MFIQFKRHIGLCSQGVLSYTLSWRFSVPNETVSGRFAPRSRWWTRTASCTRHLRPIETRWQLGFTFYGFLWNPQFKVWILQMEILLISRVLGEQGGAKDRQSQSFHKIQPFLVHTTFSLYNTHIGGNLKPGQLLHNNELSAQQYSSIIYKQTEKCLHSNVPIQGR